MLVEGEKLHTRAARAKHVEAARKRLETELGSAVRRLADLFWSSQKELAEQASRYAAIAVVIATLCALFLALFFAHESGRAYYNAKTSVLVGTATFFSVIAGLCVLYLLTKKFSDLQYLLRQKMPNLYRLDTMIASEIIQDSFAATVKKEYQQQIRNASDFVEKVKIARLEREGHRTDKERYKASGWFEMKEVADAEQVLIQMLIWSGEERGLAASSWAAAELSSPLRSENGCREDGARYAIFSTADCSGCQCKVKRGEPFQISSNPIGFLNEPERLLPEIPKTGVYRETWLRDVGHDMFRGEWYCPSCAASANRA